MKLSTSKKQKKLEALRAEEEREKSKEV